MTKESQIKLKDVEPFLNISEKDGVTLWCGNGRTSITTSNARFELVKTLISRPRECWLKAWDYFDRPDVFGPFADINGHTYKGYARTLSKIQLLNEWFPLPDLWNYVSVGNITNLRFDDVGFGLMLFPLAVTRFESRNKTEKTKHYKVRNDLAEIFDVEPVVRVSYSSKMIAKIVLDKVSPVIGGKNALLIVRSFQQNDGLKKGEAEQLADEIIEVYNKTSVEKTVELFVDSSHLLEKQDH